MQFRRVKYDLRTQAIDDHPFYPVILMAWGRDHEEAENNWWSEVLEDYSINKPVSINKPPFRTISPMSKKEIKYLSTIL